METNFKVGDTVYDSANFGKGIVESIMGDDNPIYVKFNEKMENYTGDGRIYSVSRPTLSFKPYDKLSDITQDRKDIDIDYSPYIGKWGLFWDVEEVKVIGKLKSVYLVKPSVFGMEIGLRYHHFQPLTDDQVKSLNLD